MATDKHGDKVGDNGIGEPIDRKFAIMARCYEHGHLHDDHHGMFFAAKDKALPFTLRFYRQECERIGAAPAQLRGIDLLIERVERYQATNPHLVKVPDIDAGAAGERIIAPNLPLGP